MRDQKTILFTFFYAFTILLIPLGGRINFRSSFQKRTIPFFEKIWHNFHFIWFNILKVHIVGPVSVRQSSGARLGKFRDIFSRYPIKWSIFSFLQNEEILRTSGDIPICVRIL